MSGPGSGAGRLPAAARWLMEEHERGTPMVGPRDVAKFVAEEHQAGLAEGFYGALFAPIRRTIAAVVGSGEFRDGDPDFLTWSFLGLALGMMDVGGTRRTSRPASNGPKPPPSPAARRPPGAWWTFS